MSIGAVELYGRVIEVTALPTLAIHLHSLF
jgi:hypothetical protein